jgi:hypothetical protein
MKHAPVVFRQYVHLLPCAKIDIRYDVCICSTPLEAELVVKETDLLYSLIIIRTSGGYMNYWVSIGKAVQMCSGLEKF